MTSAAEIPSTAEIRQQEATTTAYWEAKRPEPVGNVQEAFQDKSGTRSSSGMELKGDNDKQQQQKDGQKEAELFHEKKQEQPSQKDKSLSVDKKKKKQEELAALHAMLAQQEADRQAKIEALQRQKLLGEQRRQEAREKLRQQQRLEQQKLAAASLSESKAHMQELARLAQEQQERLAALAAKTPPSSSFNNSSSLSTTEKKRAGLESPDNTLGAQESQSTNSNSSNRLDDDDDNDNTDRNHDNGSSGSHISRSSILSKDSTPPNAYSDLSQDNNSTTTATSGTPTSSRIRPSKRHSTYLEIVAQRLEPEMDWSDTHLIRARRQSTMSAAEKMNYGDDDSSGRGGTTNKKDDASETKSHTSSKSSKSSRKSRRQDKINKRDDNKVPRRRKTVLRRQRSSSLSAMDRSGATPRRANSTNNKEAPPSYQWTSPDFNWANFQQQQDKENHNKQPLQRRATTLGTTAANRSQRRNSIAASAPQQRRGVARQRSSSLSDMKRGGGGGGHRRRSEHATPARSASTDTTTSTTTIWSTGTAATNQGEEEDGKEDTRRERRSRPKRRRPTRQRSSSLSDLKVERRNGKEKGKIRGSKDKNKGRNSLDDKENQTTAQGNDSDHPHNAFYDWIAHSKQAIDRVESRKAALQEHRKQKKEQLHKARNVEGKALQEEEMEFQGKEKKVLQKGSSLSNLVDETKGRESSAASATSLGKMITTTQDATSSTNSKEAEGKKTPPIKDGIKQQTKAPSGSTTGKKIQNIASSAVADQGIAATVPAGNVTTGIKDQSKAQSSPSTSGKKVQSSSSSAAADKAIAATTPTSDVTNGMKDQSKGLSSSSTTGKKVQRSPSAVLDQAIAAPAPAVTNKAVTLQEGKDKVGDQPTRPEQSAISKSPQSNQKALKVTQPSANGSNEFLDASNASMDMSMSSNNGSRRRSSLFGKVMKSAKSMIRRSSEKPPSTTNTNDKSNKGASDSPSKSPPTANLERKAIPETKDSNANEKKQSSGALQGMDVGASPSPLKTNSERRATPETKDSNANEKKKASDALRGMNVGASASPQKANSERKAMPETKDSKKKASDSLQKMDVGNTSMNGNPASPPSRATPTRGRASTPVAKAAVAAPPVKGNSASPASKAAPKRGRASPPVAKEAAAAPPVKGSPASPASRATPTRGRTSTPTAKAAAAAAAAAAPPKRGVTRQRSQSLSDMVRGKIRAGLKPKPRESVFNFVPDAPKAADFVEDDYQDSPLRKLDTYEDELTLEPLQKTIANLEKQLRDTQKAEAREVDEVIKSGRDMFEKIGNRKAETISNLPDDLSQLDDRMKRNSDIIAYLKEENKKRRNEMQKIKVDFFDVHQQTVRLEQETEETLGFLQKLEDVYYQQELDKRKALLRALAACKEGDERLSNELDKRAAYCEFEEGLRVLYQKDISRLLVMFETKSDDSELTQLLIEIACGKHDERLEQVIREMPEEEGDQ